MKKSLYGHFKVRDIVLICSFCLILVFVSGNAGIYKSFPSEENIPWEWTGVERIVAVGDLHGAYGHFLEILEGTGLIDKSQRWIGGRAHLVQIGDVMDRGDGPKDIFDLAIRLEKEAEEAGGRVHMLIGNHEEMNLANTAFDRPGYITVGQFTAFLPENYIKSQEKKFTRKARSNPLGSYSRDSDFSIYWEEIINKGIGNPDYVPRKYYYKTFNEQYGQWILSHNIAVKINGIVFVHGGISESFSRQGLKEINNRFRIEMEDLRVAILREQPPTIPEYDREIYNNPNGPLWYRDLARPESPRFGEVVDRILANLDAVQMVIAHTPQTAVGVEQMKRYGGRVWIIDTGIADYYRPIGGHVSALVYENGEWFVWYPEDSRESADENFPTGFPLGSGGLHPVYLSPQMIPDLPEYRGRI